MRMSNPMKRKFTILMFIVSAVVSGASAAGGYHLLKTVRPPADVYPHQVSRSSPGGWDYCIVDADNRRLYQSHGNHVVVMDVDSDAPIGKIDKTPGVHGIALAPELNRGFTSNGQANTSTIFDLKTMATIGEVKIIGTNPDSIIYDPATKRVFVFNGKHTLSNATVIDAKAGTVLGKIDLGGNPEFAASDGKGHVFVDLVDKDVVLQIDSQKLTAEKRLPVGTCKRPSTMAIDRAHGRLFVGCDNKQMDVMDTASGRVITTVPIGSGDDAVTFDPGASLVFSSNGEDGTVTVIHEDSPDAYSVVETVKTEPGARTMAVDTKTHKIYLPLADRKPGPAPTAADPDPPDGPVIVGSFRILVFGM
jgi:DNA-binding beta-propeller fold protein YncE